MKGPQRKYIRVKVVEAKDLLPLDRNGFSDPFCVVTHNGDKAGNKTTDIQKKTVNPKWKDESNEFTFRVENELMDTLKFVVWDYDKIGMNDFEGKVTIPVAGAANTPNEKVDMWVKLLSKKGKLNKNRGELHVELTFIDPSAKNVSQSPSIEKLGESGLMTADWMIPFKDLEMLKELGRGAFGVVYKGKWRLQDCAIKVLPKEKMGAKELAEFKDECALMASLRPHRNLVTFLGVSMDENSPLCLVTDFVDGGALEGKLHDPSFNLDWSLILKFAKGICAGMHHLHREGLLHRDLATRNILLSASLEPQVADFGLSKKVDQLDAKSQNLGKSTVQEHGFFRGPYKWMAPESLSQNVFSPKTDVWSYGVTVWEILSRSLPFPEIDIYQAADAIVSSGLRLPLAAHWPPKWKELLTKCWDVDPQKRPDFVAIMSMLDSIEAEMRKFNV